MISDSQSVFTNVVRPVPEAPVKRDEARGQHGVAQEQLTDNHNGELNTLLYVLSARGHF
jgi:hypothetical protein